MFVGPVLKLAFVINKLLFKYLRLNMHCLPKYVCIQPCGAAV